LVPPTSMTRIFGDFGTGLDLGGESFAMCRVFGIADSPFREDRQF
jgi:hypothetical protein